MEKAIEDLKSKKEEEKEAESDQEEQIEQESIELEDDIQDIANEDFLIIDDYD